jgi:hypothetical protein
VELYLHSQYAFMAWCLVKTSTETTLPLHLKGRDHSENLSIDGRIIWNGFWENRLGRCGLDSFSSGQGPVAGYFEYDNEPSGSII